MFIYLAIFMYILLFLIIASLSPFHYTEDVFRIGISDSIIIVIKKGAGPIFDITSITICRNSKQT